MQSTVMQIL